MDVEAKEIKKYYSEWWENPKDIRNVVFESLNELVKERIPPGEGKKALDIGSGHGRIVSYLLEKGYDVTAVEFNEEFVTELKIKFPSVKVIAEDVRNVDLDETFDLVTCIEFAPLLNETELVNFLSKIVKVSPLILINMSNRNSLHSTYVKLRGWQNDFIFDYTPEQFEHLVEEAGFRAVYRRGVGLVTPISLFRGFKGKFIPVWFAREVNKLLDTYATKRCHLYYVEAEKVRE
ncbi:MAG: hypothetical protein C4B55_04230 [Candidatus Methanophagaceae archaeon]|nr:MAG: hypothetical protein C4B55_04230 [Methanophagales archaeon]